MTNVPIQPRGSRVLQFSLTAVFLVMTVVAVVFSAFFGIGHVLGMSTTEVAMQGMARLVFSLPMLLVWTLGLSVAVQHLRRNPLPAKLAIFALGPMIVILLTLQIAQMVLMQGLQANWIDSSSISWYFAAISLLSAVVNTLGWILILVAVFVGRPPASEPLRSQIGSSDPFADDEPIAASIAENESTSNE